MKSDEAKEKLHQMRGALSVLVSFLGNTKPQDKDEGLHLKAAKKSLEKLSAAVEELDALVTNDSQ
jgi:hypothetical protein